MTLFTHPEFDRHETVSFCHDAETGLRAIIAVHNTNLGKGLGGFRMWPYASEAEALTDVLRLSRGMTYKEIGRASCRERVCLRVDFGGRRIIKKKKKKTRRKEDKE